MKNLILIVVGAMLVTSCHKSYVCKDKMGNTTGEVKALNLEKANERCPGDNTAEPK